MGTQSTWGKRRVPNLKVSTMATSKFSFFSLILGVLGLLAAGEKDDAQVGAASMDAGVQESFPHQSKRLLFGSMPGKIQGAPVLSGSLTPRSGSFESSSGDEAGTDACSNPCGNLGQNCGALHGILTCELIGFLQCDCTGCCSEAVSAAMVQAGLARRLMEGGQVEA